MSRNEWERGTLKLPSAAVAPLKAKLREVANGHHEQVLKLAQQVWEVHIKKTRSTTLWMERLDAWRMRTNRDSRQESDTVQEDVYMILHTMATEWSGHPATLRKPTVTDVTRIAPKYTTASKHFTVDGGEAGITFEGREVTWSVGSNNHAVEHARATPLARAFFSSLNRITWTRGTGGDLVGNDEYNQDSDYEGGGANYVTASYPPPKAAPRSSFLTYPAYPSRSYYR